MHINYLILYWFSYQKKLRYKSKHFLVSLNNYHQIPLLKVLNMELHLDDLYNIYLKMRLPITRNTIIMIYE